MTSSRLFRLGGLSAVVGGALIGIDVVLHLFVDDTLKPAALGGLAHELWHAPGILGLPLALLGLVAIYLGQHRETGRVGLCGFFLLVIGMTVGAVYSTLFHGLFLPAIESIEAGLFEKLVSNTTAAQFYRGVVVQGLGLGLGAILFGIATIRAKVFPAVGGWLFIAAALFSAANEALPQGQLIGRTLFAVAFVWMGVDLIRSRARPTSPSAGSARTRRGR
ncbi:MAG: hypothetical protein GY946_28800 [bacterium]|nr:hypothetical protein [bacterium]